MLKKMNDSYDPLNCKKYPSEGGFEGDDNFDPTATETIHI